MTRLIILLFLASCTQLSFWRKQDPLSQQLSKYEAFTEKDFLDYLSSLGQVYNQTEGVRVLQLPKHFDEYFKDIFKKIISNNEQILKFSSDPKFYIIKDEKPFYFSLPYGQFFFSLGLFKRYIKNEHLLYAVLAQEVLKSLRGIYEKKIIVPKGFISTEQILAMVQIPREVKYNLNKWTFYVLKRTGSDPFAFLNWLQILNKNALDFNLTLGGLSDITREEYLFKNFVVKEGLQNQSLDEEKLRLSKDFYKLQAFLRRF